jgi:hypothetical protein
MMSYHQVDIAELFGRFSWGVNGILRIRDTFRTNIGAQYGPEFIDLGVRIGKEIYQHLQRHLDSLTTDEEFDSGERIDIGDQSDG